MPSEKYWYFVTVSQFVMMTRIFVGWPNNGWLSDIRQDHQLRASPIMILASATYSFKIQTWLHVLTGGITMPWLHALTWGVVTPWLHVPTEGIITTWLHVQTGDIIKAWLHVCSCFKTTNQALAYYGTTTDISIILTRLCIT